MSTWRWHVHVWPHCLILTEACLCRLEQAYFAGKISKNGLVCKNFVALAYYGNCRLLVMGSCFWRLSGYNFRRLSRIFVVRSRIRRVRIRLRGSIWLCQRFFNSPFDRWQRERASDKSYSDYREEALTFAAITQRGSFDICRRGEEKSSCTKGTKSTEEWKRKQKSGL